MNIAEIVSELKAEKARIDRAISALEGSSSNGAVGSSPDAASRTVRKRGHLSAEGRRPISEMMKKRWAERRKRQGSKKP